MAAAQLHFESIEYIILHHLVVLARFTALRIALTIYLPRVCANRRERSVLFAAAPTVESSEQVVEESSRLDYFCSTDESSHWHCFR